MSNNIIKSRLDQILAGGAATAQLCEEIIGSSAMPKAKELQGFNRGIEAADRIFDLIEGEKDASKKPGFGLIAVDQPKDEATISVPIAFADHCRERVKLDEEATDVDVIKAAINGHWSRRVVILMPTSRQISPHVMFALMANLKRQPWVGFQMEADTIIQRSRNLLADAFLKSDAEWSVWVDDDVVLPFGDEGYFYHRLGASQSREPKGTYSKLAVERLLSHKKKIVGGVYFQRQPGGTSITAPGLRPKNNAENIIREEINSGPRDKLIAVDWIATGCALVHRDVYLDIIAKNPDRKPESEGQPFDFFGHDVSKRGEDVEFCKLAREAGHQPHLDMGLWCKHIGNYAY